MEQKGRCVHCHSDVSVPASYADGDHIKCGGCGTQHRVLRTPAVRLVVADVAPLREELRVLQQRIDKLENELRTARGSLGIGANGFGFGLIYVLWQIGLEEALLNQELILTAVFVGVTAGIALELANFLFLSKRKLINQLASELQLMRDETQELQRKIREGSLRR